MIVFNLHLRLTVQGAQLGGREQGGQVGEVAVRLELGMRNRLL